MAILLHMGTSPKSNRPPIALKSDWVSAIVTNVGRWLNLPFVKQGRKMMLRKPLWKRTELGGTVFKGNSLKCGGQKKLHLRTL